jgi:hypothetical protein
MMPSLSEPRTDRGKGHFPERRPPEAQVTSGEQSSGFASTR